MIYKSDFPVNFTTGRQSVANQGYVIENRRVTAMCIDPGDREHARRSFHGPLHEELFILPSSDWSSSREYDPLIEEPELWTKFASLRRTDEAILEFVSNYGLLGIGEDVNRAEPIPHVDGIMMESPEGLMGFSTGESLERFRAELSEFQTMVTIWGLVDSGSEGALRKFVTWSGEDEEVAVFFLWPTREGPYAQWISGIHSHRSDYVRRWRRGSARGPALLFLSDMINERIRAISYELRLGKNDKLQQYLVPYSLLTAIWYQFSQVVTGQKQYRRCVVCGEWMDVTDARRDKKQHIACGNRARQARHKPPKNRNA